MEFVGLIFFIILIYWRPQDFIPIVQNLRLVFIVMVPTYFLWGLNILKTKSFSRLLVFPLDFCIVGLFFSIVISTYNVHWLRYTYNLFVGFGKILLFFILIATTITNIFRLKICFYLLSFLTFLIAGVALLQLYNINLFGVGMVEGRIQGIGIYHNPNYLAYSVIMVFPIQFFLFNETKYLPVKIIHFIVLIISFICVFFTKSRGGILCLVGTTVFLLIRNKRPFMKYLLLFAGVVIFIFLRIGPRFDVLGRSDGSIQARIDAWYSGLEMLKEHPFIGVGIGMFNYYHKEKTSHSSFVHVGSETGLIGLFFWISMLYFSIKLLYAIYSKDKYKQIALALEGSIVSYILASFFVTFPYRIIVFMLCGFISALLRIDLLEGMQTVPDKEKIKMSLFNRISFSYRDIVNILIIESSILFIWHLVIRFRW
ncbi:O-antigen ligase family protein [Chlamydiota bacterium]